MIIKKEMINLLKQTYNNRYKGWGEIPSKDAVVIDVTRTAGHLLAPSYELLMDYKNKKITWDQYVVRYKKEMDNESCRIEMRKIKKMAETQDVYLVCVCFNKENRCHRFLLMDMIENMR